MGIETVTWAISALALIGVVLNIHKDQRCFVIWSGTNLFWALYDWSIGARAQSALFLIYFILAIWGLVKWSKGRPP